jgi:hypothetical protein
MIILFGLSNTPNIFMRFMHKILRPFIYIFIMVYLDNILIYSFTLEFHLKHPHVIFYILRKEQLYMNCKKCDFFTSIFTFLNLTMFVDRFQINPSKISVIMVWPTSKCVHDVQSFHGLIFFYKRFI